MVGRRTLRSRPSIGNARVTPFKNRGKKKNAPTLKTPSLLNKQSIKAATKAAAKPMTPAARKIAAAAALSSPVGVDESSPEAVHVSTVATERPTRKKLKNSQLQIDSIEKTSDRTDNKVAPTQGKKLPQNSKPKRGNRKLAAAASVKENESSQSELAAVKSTGANMKEKSDSTDQNDPDPSTLNKETDESRRSSISTSTRGAPKRSRSSPAAKPKRENRIKKSAKTSKEKTAKKTNEKIEKTSMEEPTSRTRKSLSGSSIHDEAIAKTDAHDDIIESTPEMVTDGMKGTKKPKGAGLARTSKKKKATALSNTTKPSSAPRRQRRKGTSTSIPSDVTNADAGNGDDVNRPRTLTIRNDSQGEDEAKTPKKKLRVSFSNLDADDVDATSSKSGRKSSIASSTSSTATTISSSNPSSSSADPSSGWVSNSTTKTKEKSSLGIKSPKARKTARKSPAKVVIDPYSFDEEDTMIVKLPVVKNTQSETSPSRSEDAEEEAEAVPGGRFEEMERSICMSASKKRKSIEVLLKGWGKKAKTEPVDDLETQKRLVKPGKKKKSFGSRMANMRRVIEAGGEAQSLKRKSILKNAASHLTQHTNQPASASHFPKGAILSQRSRPVAAAVKDHSTPNQPNSGVQTKIPQFLKGIGSSSQAEARLPLGNLNGNRKLNDSLFGFEANPTPAKRGTNPVFGEAEISAISSVSTLLSPIQKTCNAGGRNLDMDSINASARDSVISFTGQVISKKHPEVEQLFLKPGKATKKATAGKKPRGGGTKKNVKKPNATTTTKKMKNAGIMDVKNEKKKTSAKVIQKENDKNDNVVVNRGDGGGEGTGEAADEQQDEAAAAAFEAWCKKQNQHFDDCESFELSIEVDSME